MGKAKTPKKTKPQRDPKGHFLPGNRESVGGTGHAPCTYCLRKDEVLKATYLYMAYCNGELPNEPTLQIPYLEELCLRLDILTETLEDWCNKPICGDKGDHADIIRAKKKVSQMQKLRLLQRTNANNPVGAIFQLKANHGMIETEKRVLAGIATEPLEIIITEETEQDREGTDNE